MFGDEPRQIVRHRAPRRRLNAVVRPYPVVVAGVVTLASVPVLAAVLVGPASLTTTSDRHSPVVADSSQAPVVIPGRGNVAAAPTTRPSAPTDLSSPTPVPTSTSPVRTGDTASTAGRRSNLRRDPSRGEGSDSRSGSAPRRSAPAPRPSETDGSPAAPLPSAPLPSDPPIPPPGIPGILPNAPISSLPAPVPGAAASVTGAVGGLLSVLAS